MVAKYSEEGKVLLSSCDSTKRLGIPDTFEIFMDVATKHADILKVGDCEFGPRGLFWVVVRTKIHFNKRPQLMSDITVSTWPDEPQRVRCDRNYVISANGEVLVCGRSEWAVIELESGRLQTVKDVYPDDIEFCGDCALEEPYTRFKESFEDAQLFASYRVSSTDIDFGGHMNNAAYIRALASCYECSAWNNLKISDIEINYKNQCYEGDVLKLRRKSVSDGILIDMSLSDGTQVAVLKIS